MRWMTGKSAGVTALALLVAVTAMTTSAAAEEFPSRPIRLVVPYSAGGSTDLIARMVASEMAKSLQQPVVVENKPGAGAVVGNRLAVSARPDGYTILLGTTTLPLTKFAYKEPGFTFEDFRILAPIATLGFVLSIPGNASASTLADLVAEAKAAPGKLHNGAVSDAGTNFLIMDRFKSLAGIDMVDVKYPGSAQVLNDLQSGTIQAFMTAGISTKPLLEGKRIKSVAVTTPERMALLPDIPTFAESGYPDVVGGSWYALLVSTKVPADIQTKLSEAAEAAAKAPEVQIRLREMAIEPWEGSKDDFEAYVQTDLEKWTADIKRMGLQPQ